MGYFDLGGTTPVGTNESKWKGKIWSVIGDSNTESNFRADKKYHDFIKEKVDCQVNNYGMSGTGWFSDYNVENGMVAYYKRLDEIATNSDLITVLGGGNDYGKSLPIGALGDTAPTASFYGAVEHTLSELIKLFPDKKIAVLTQFRRNLGTDIITTERIEQMVEAQIKVAGKFGLPCLDLYHASNQYPWIPSYIDSEMPDGVHLNDLGQEKLSKIILPFLETI